MVGLATIALLSVAVMFIFRLTRWEVVEQNVNWGIILMYGGAIALGSALHTTGASEWLVANSLGRLHLPGPVVLVALGLLALVLTEFISNAAVVSVLVPIGIGFARSYGLSPEAVTLAIALPSGLAYTLPLGTPATAIAYSSGYMTMKDFLSVCPLMNLFSFLVFAAVALLYWPLLGF
jgi:sodium-dependent dicarboxylate transporter 2/3/5